jgi:hypothetical protein
MLLPCTKLMKLDPCLLRHCQWGSFIGNCSFTEKTVITEFFLYFIGNMFYRIFIFCKYRFFLYYSLFSVLQFFSCKSFIGFIFQKSHFFTVYILYYRKKSFYRIEAWFLCNVTITTFRSYLATLCSQSLERKATSEKYCKVKPSQTRSVTRVCFDLKFNHHTLF